MNTSSAKRSRAGNFDTEDIELFLNLVNENKTLIDSGKQEDKKKGWDNVTDGFNSSCSGIKRDVAALKMKLKNLKAHNKKVKLEDGSERLEMEADGSELDTSETSPGQKGKNLRKRSKVWTVDETELLTELVEKHFHCLDTSLTRESLELRSQAWETITEEFNRSKAIAITRDMGELKIKLKNMKAKRSSFKTESESGHSAVFIEVEPIPQENVKNTRSKVQESSPTRNNQRSSMPAPSRLPQKVKAYEVVLDALDPTNDYSDEDDYPQPTLKTPVPTTGVTASEDKEEARIRKENLLLKNSVLRKKERLLELQISLAERNLRRHQLQ